MHGHSYHVEVWILGTALNGYVIHEEKINAECLKVKALLDHKYLNAVIELPTSENIAKFIWEELKHLRLFEIRVERPTVAFGVVYNGELW